MVEKPINVALAEALLKEIMKRKNKQKDHQQMNIVVERETHEEEEDAAIYSR